MPEVNQNSSAVTLKIPRSALFASGGVALVGVGIAAGMLLRSPASSPDNIAATQAPVEAQLALAPTGAGNVASQALVSGVAPATAASEPVPQAAKPHHSKHSASPQTKEVLSGGQAGTANTYPTTEAAPPICVNCGVVESVRAVQQKGQGSGVGAVAGGVLGGLVGNQMGKGNGKTAMTVLGAIGGGLAGNEVEKQQKASTVYEVHVRMDDGSLRTVTQNTEPAMGAHVEVNGHSLRVLN